MNSGSEKIQPGAEMPGVGIRAVLSLLLLLYLLLVLLGPLSIPISSENLTRPLAQAVEPVQRALFLQHGYRFFGPDPGPSHFLEYRIETEAGDDVTGRIPDRQSHWPRLLYHRWFMLSETIYADSFFLSNQEDHETAVANLNIEIEELRFRNELPSMQKIIEERDRLKIDYDFRKTRIEMLLQQVATYLLSQHNGKSVDLFLRERLIARPVDVASRVRLNDSRFLSEPSSLGTFKPRRPSNIEVSK